MKALPMPLLCIEGTANFPYQILLVSFHLQYRDDKSTSKDHRGAIDTG